ncbi:hypothetical protein H4R19_004559 [Coemansia spiralis]|nr:hypothetical protein H4R19_004559 [Coemansia spiralis]
MSESPSAYLPRQLRPRGAEPPGRQRNYSTTSSASYSAQIPPAAGLTTPVPRARVDAIRVDGAGHALSAVSISEALGERIRRLGSSAGSSLAEPTVCAYLLGYVDCDGVAQLNRLDHGIQSSSGERLPTAAHAADVIVPLYRGATAGRFYASALRPGHMFQLACWLAERISRLEFVHIKPDIRVSVEPASAVEIADLPRFLEELCRNPGAASGPLRREEGSHIYIHEHRPLLPTERAAWVVSEPGGSDDAVRQAYICAGLPRSLHVALVIPDNGCRSALVRHCTVAPGAGEFDIRVLLASVELKVPAGPDTRVARLAPAAEYSFAAAEAIRSTVAQYRIAVVDRPRDRTRQTPKCQPSPLLEKLVASARALTSPVHGHPAAERARSGTVTRQPPTAPAPAGDATSNNHMVELLSEQRQIRALLEEQNKLIKTQVSQAQEMMRLAQHQPSPQTVTRRYLRMRGTHTPSLAGAPVRALEDSGTRSSVGQTIRRSNSLSEIVDGIRSFEVEGYEETEQRAGPGARRPLSFVSPLGAGGMSLIEESPSQPRAAATGSLGASSGISTLVTRINRLVSNGPATAAAPAAPGAFGRPPLPAYGRPPVPGHSQRVKITPTTQKYLDALSSHGSR